MFVLPMVEIETKKIRKQKNLPLKTCLKTTGQNIFIFSQKIKKWVYSDSWFNDKKIEKVTEEELKYTFKSLSDEVNNQCSDEQRKDLKEMVKALESENDEEMQVKKTKKRVEREKSRLRGWNMRKKEQLLNKIKEQSILNGSKPLELFTKEM